MPTVLTSAALAVACVGARAIRVNPTLHAFSLFCDVDGFGLRIELQKHLWLMATGTGTESESKISCSSQTPDLILLLPSQTR